MNTFFCRKFYVILFNIIVGNLLIECQVSKLLLFELQNKTSSSLYVLAINY